MHGGYGYIAEGGIERYLRDIRVNRILEGTNEIMKLIISRKIVSEAKWKKNIKINNKFIKKDCLNNKKKNSKTNFI